MKTCILTTITTLFILAGGCGLEKRDPADVRHFLLDVQRTPSAASVKSDICLRVRLCRVAAAFDSQSLIYRTGPVRYETDYYNRFLTNPENQVTDILQHWFRQAGFRDCGLTGEPEQDKLTLEPFIEALYADFAASGQRAAVVRMHVRLTRYDTDCACVKIVLDKTFTEQTPLPDNPTAADVVKGMSRSLTRIIEQTEQSVNGSIQDALTKPVIPKTARKSILNSSRSDSL